MTDKIFSRILLIIAIAFSSAGCTQNDGNIGDLFGVWRLNQLKADGTPLPLYEGDDSPLAYDWSFQGDVMKIDVVEPHHDHQRCYAMWKREDGKLLIDFSYGSDASTEFDPPAALHLVRRGVTPLELTELTSKKLVGWYIGEDGVKYEYTLKKLY